MANDPNVAEVTLIEHNKENATYYVVSASGKTLTQAQLDAAIKKGHEKYGVAKVTVSK